MNDDTSGALIAFFGLPGAGKSSIAAELSGLVGGTLLLEPEEDEWADAVLAREVSGYFTAVTWFRSIRVPQIHQADVGRAKSLSLYILTQVFTAPRAVARKVPSGYRNRWLRDCVDYGKPVRGGTIASIIRDLNAKVSIGSFCWNWR